MRYSFGDCENETTVCQHARRQDGSADPAPKEAFARCQPAATFDFIDSINAPMRAAGSWLAGISRDFMDFGGPKFAGWLGLWDGLNALKGFKEWKTGTNDLTGSNLEELGRFFRNFGS